MTFAFKRIFLRMYLPTFTKWWTNLAERPCRTGVIILYASHRRVFVTCRKLIVVRVHSRVFCDFSTRAFDDPLFVDDTSRGNNVWALRVLGYFNGYTRSRCATVLRSSTHSKRTDEVKTTSISSNMTSTTRTVTASSPNYSCSGYRVGAHPEPSDALLELILRLSSAKSAVFASRSSRGRLV